MNDFHKKEAVLASFFVIKYYKSKKYGKFSMH